MVCPVLRRLKHKELVLSQALALSQPWNQSGEKWVCECLHLHPPTHTQTHYIPIVQRVKPNQKLNSTVHWYQRFSIRSVPIDLLWFVFKWKAEYVTCKWSYRDLWPWVSVSFLLDFTFSYCFSVFMMFVGIDLWVVGLYLQPITAWVVRCKNQLPSFLFGTFHAGVAVKACHGLEPVCWEHDYVNSWNWVLEWTSVKIPPFHIHDFKVFASFLSRCHSPTPSFTRICYPRPFAVFVYRGAHASCFLWCWYISVAVLQCHLPAWRVLQCLHWFCEDTHLLRRCIYAKLLENEKYYFRLHVKRGCSARFCLRDKIHPHCSLVWVCF